MRVAVKVQVQAAVVSGLLLHGAGCRCVCLRRGKKTFAFTKYCEANEDLFPCRGPTLWEPHEGALLGKFYPLRRLESRMKGGSLRRAHFIDRDLGEPHEWGSLRRFPTADQLLESPMKGVLPGNSLLPTDCWRAP